MAFVIAAVMFTPVAFAQSGNTATESQEGNQQGDGRAADPLLGLRLMRGGSTDSSAASATSQPPAVKTGSVSLNASTSYRVYLDGQLQGTASAHEPYKFDASVGEHVIEAVTIDARKARWRTAIDVKPKADIDLKPQFK